MFKKFNHIYIYIIYILELERLVLLSDNLQNLLQSYLFNMVEKKRQYAGGGPPSPSSTDTPHPLLLQSRQPASHVAVPIPPRPSPSWPIGRRL